MDTLQPDARCPPQLGGSRPAQRHSLCSPQLDNNCPAQLDPTARHKLFSKSPRALGAAGPVLSM